MSPVTIYPHIDPVWPYLCTVAVFEALTVYLWQFRTIPGAKLLALCQAIKAFWLLSVVFYSISADIPTKLFWIRLSALSPVLLIYCWFKFILTLSEQKKTFPAVVRYGIPTIVVCLILIIFFDNQLGWHWKSISLDGQAFKAVFGPVSWATIGFSYFLGLLSIGLCIRWIFIGTGTAPPAGHCVNLNATVYVIGKYTAPVSGVSGVYAAVDRAYTGRAVHNLGFLSLAGLQHLATGPRCGQPLHDRRSAGG